MNVDGEHHGLELRALGVGGIRKKKVENRNRRASKRHIILSRNLLQLLMKMENGRMCFFLGPDMVFPALVSELHFSQAPHYLPRMRVAFPTIYISHHSLDIPQRLCHPL